MFAKIRLPQALPDIFTGMKVGAALAATAAIVAEFVASDKGLGYLLLQYNGNLDTPMVFAVIFLLSFIGLIVYYTVEMIERFTIPWHVSQANAGRPPELRSHQRKETEHEHQSSRLLAGLLVCMAATSAAAQEAVSLRLNWYLGGLHVPFYYGKEHGLLQAGRHRPDDQRRPGFGQHGAGGCGRVRHLRHGRLVEPSSARRPRAPTSSR